MPSVASSTNYGRPLDRYPSAFLVLRQVRVWNVTTDVTCSIQANWFPGSSAGKEVCAADLTSVTVQGHLNNEGVNTFDLPALTSWAHPLQETIYSNFNKRPLWPSVKLTKSWLDLLTPPLQANDTGWTTLASTIDSVLSLQSAFNVSEALQPSWPIYQINVIVASFILDGMARLGIVDNQLDALDAVYTCLDSEPPCEWTWKSSDWNKVNKDIINGKATLVPTSASRDSLGNFYHIQFVISGES